MILEYIKMKKTNNHLKDHKRKLSKGMERLAGI